METADIIGQIVNELDYEIKVDSIVDESGGIYTVNVCETLHLQEGFPITIDGNDYTIEEVVNNTSIKLKGTVLPNVEEFNAYPVYYFHGTVIKLQDDMNAQKDASVLSTRMPFIYLREQLKDKRFTKYSDSPLGKLSDLVLLFLTESKYQDWKTVDHYEKAIAPMRNLTDMFIEAVNKSVLVRKFKEYDTINHVNFGVYSTNRGSKQALFTDQLSGIELDASFPFSKDACKRCN